MPIPGGNEVAVLAAPALGSVMPWFIGNLMVTTSLTELERAIGGAVAKWSMFVKITPFFQLIFDSVEGIHLLTIFFWGQSGNITLLDPTLGRGFS